MATINFQYDLTPDEARKMAFAERCRGNMKRAQEFERMAIPTIVSRYPELFAPRPIRIPYDERDEIIHTSDRPFCWDPTCGCHRDAALIEEYLVEPNAAGLLTSEEGLRLLTGEQL